MRGHGIRSRGPKRFARTTDSNHRRPVAANVLDREFEPDGPNEKWCADLTYLPTREGWLCLAVVEDLFSRMIVGWSTGASMEGRLVVDALEMAIRCRRPEAGLLALGPRGPVRERTPPAGAGECRGRVQHERSRPVPG
jgi:transposase InsO family protein